MFARKPRYRITRGTGIAAALGFMALGAVLALAARPAVQRIRESRSPEAPPDDGALVERVRVAISRTVPGAEVVDIRAREGRVTLRGPARPDQIGEMVAAAARVAGVREVDNRLSLSEA